MFIVRFVNKGFQLKLGVCYYPEHWPEAWWADDARRMKEIGISYVRLAEFSWSLIEPEPNRFSWAWLDRAVETLAREGLSIIMATPTATPPKWLVDAHPDILAVDAQGLSRNFGSRRHYCFSSTTFRQHSRRITQMIAERYGSHAAVVAWQTDNEYGCHDTVISYSPAARVAFRLWLTSRYQTIETLNRTWGCEFWSQTYRNFDEIDPPVATVTEANPSHRLDWQRFSSDQVAAFNREQVDIIRKFSPGRDVTHNFMGFFTAFDHRKVAVDLDVAAWDSYPLGFTQMFFLSDQEKLQYARTGHPDIPGFHHDLYRGMCIADNANAGRWWVMEQQPGPVNWASWNPLPHQGMVRLWTWEAFSHGAELVSYFRWRQAPFGQEQMHSGLQRCDRNDDQGAVEAAVVGRELNSLRESLPKVNLDNLPVRAAVAIIFDYDALWMAQIQPQGADYNGLELCFRIYSALRQLGLNVDIVGSTANLKQYCLIVLPAMLHVSSNLAAQLEASSAEIVLGPRTASKTRDLHIPPNLAPGPLAKLAGIKVLRVESLMPGLVNHVRFKEELLLVTRWREELMLKSATAEAVFDDGGVAISRHNSVRYVSTWLEPRGWFALLRVAALDAGLPILELPPTLRVNRIGELTFALNFGDDTVSWSPDGRAEILLGKQALAPREVTIWRSLTATA